MNVQGASNSVSTSLEEPEKSNKEVVTYQRKTGLV